MPFDKKQLRLKFGFSFFDEFLYTPRLYGQWGCGHLIVFKKIGYKLYTIPASGFSN